MTRPTPTQVRVRGLTIVFLTLATVVLILLGAAYAGTSDWFLALLALLDLPAIAILLFVERWERTHA